MRLIFKTTMLIYPSKANLDEDIWFGKITNHLDPESRKIERKMLAKDMFGKEDPHFILVYDFAIEIKILFLEPTL